MHTDNKRTQVDRRCRNCVHQIEPLRSCEWMEQGGDGVVYLVCPRWTKRQKDTEGGHQ